MISLILDHSEKIVVKPTIFPDKTSQMWHLPPQVFSSDTIGIDWRFEEEREILDILSISKLLNPTYLYVPYLPYARQDKRVANEATFNLAVLAEILSLCKFTRIETLDVHNAKKTKNLIPNLANNKRLALCLIKDSLQKISDKPVALVFPDAGAYERYEDGAETINKVPFISCSKVRNQETGQIIRHKFAYGEGLLREFNKFLIVDDICDGGATFISVANTILKENQFADINLHVTHGIFSKGRQILHDNGIKRIFTTNSLPHNKAGDKDVYEV